ncbi:DNA topoisomerase 3-beta-1 [Symbiodinium microadriaticum]|uniref:DNA topoisomerase n=1 Tax=Symbiodinium microadriaticum TaxID=2951 RepID=A0A1Q9F0E1_SYMMI|nr:DNA topoisomerase 3-beta-1 [Symbiodinium microadriaticum]
MDTTVFGAYAQDPEGGEWHFRGIVDDLKTEIVSRFSNPRKGRLLHELDLKIGCIFTRLMTRQFLRYAIEKSLAKAEGRFRLRDQTCLSYGPCQTPTLWFCVERHKEIQNFQRQEFYKPKVSVNLDGWPLEFDWLQDQTFDAGRVKSLQSRAQSAKQAVVKELRTTAKTLKKPVGRLNTVQLLKAASTGLGRSTLQQCSDHFEQVAEHLYTSGYISYPRTETTRYSDTFDLHAALREQADHPAWGKTVSHLLRQGQIRNPKTGRDVGDHPPITPMKAAPRDEFSKGQVLSTSTRVKVDRMGLGEYDREDLSGGSTTSSPGHLMPALVVFLRVSSQRRGRTHLLMRHFIASLMPDVEYDEKALIVNVGGEDFAYTFHEMRERGFLFAMPWKSKDLNLNEIDWAMPRLAPGSPLRVEEVWVESDFTKPPDYLPGAHNRKESELVALMDKHGIGTDASIPQHVENICNRNYVMVCGPGEDGQRGERIPKGGKKGKGKAGKAALGRAFDALLFFPLEGKGKGKDGKAQGGEKPQSRHMVSASAPKAFQCRQDESIRRFRHHWDSDPNKVMVEARDQILSPERTDESISTALEVIDRCCDDPDCARNAEKLDVLQPLLDLASSHEGSIRSRTFEILALLFSNNPNIQEAGVKRHALALCMRIAQERTDSDVGSKTEFEKLLLDQSGGVALLTQCMDLQELPGTREKAASFVRSLVENESMAAEHAAPLATALAKLFSNLEDAGIQYKETLASCALQLGSGFKAQCPPELLAAVTARVSELTAATDPEAEQELSCLKDCAAVLNA